MATDRQNQLLQTAYNAGITSPRELANFMAQVGHESTNLSRLNESFRYTQSAEQVSDVVRSALRQGRPRLEEARLEALAGRPQDLAELMYGGRMGNNAPGDGYRYHGRGYIQLTGKEQYEAAGKALGLDLVANPALAAEPDNAARIAVHYWQQNVPAGSRLDARSAGAAINGSDPPNGLADREQKFAQWQARLPQELMATLEAGTLGRAVAAGAPARNAAAPAPAAVTSFDATLQTMMPAQGGTRPHITGQYGENRGSRNHGGVDFNYVGGQSGRNLQHPVVNSPVSGRVSYSGGSFGTVKIVDAQGNSHEIMHLHSRSVNEGDSVRAGQPIGTMGGRGPDGPNQYAQHVHYQLRNPDGQVIDPVGFWNGRQRDAADIASSAPAMDTRQLQERLAALGYRGQEGQPLASDGIAGPHTRHALRAFQHDHGLQVDGIAGPHTQAALASQPALPRIGSRGPLVENLQQQLNQLGVTDASGRPLDVDGRFGPSTRQALEAFQQANGLKVDGVLGPRSRDALQSARQPDVPAATQAAPASAPGLLESPLFRRLRECMPDNLSLEKIGLATTCALKAGIDAPEKVQQVHMQGDTAHVVGVTPGFRASVDLSGNLPSLADSQARLQAEQALQRTQTAAPMTLSA